MFSAPGQIIFAFVFTPIFYLTREVELDCEVLFKAITLGSGSLECQCNYFRYLPVARVF